MLPSRPRPDEPVPISLVITELDVGGAERALVALATGLDRSRWSPTVLSLDEPGPLVEPLSAAGIPTICLGASRRRALSAMFRLTTALRRNRPALVQSFLFHANVASRIAAVVAGRPWVVGGIRVAEHERSRHRALERWTARLATGSVCVSEGVRQFSIDVTRIPEDRLVVIPNGIDPVPLDRAEPVPRPTIGVPESAPMMLFVGRLVVQKGLDVLLHAFGDLARSHPSPHLVVVGEGPESSRLRDLIGPDDPARPRVRWLGWRSDVPALLKTADLLVLPSRWEGMPNVILEAMAAGRPVIATAVEGSRELVVPGQTGWLVPPDDSDALGRTLVEALADPARLRQYGDAGRRRVLASYSLDAVISAYDRLWSGILGYADEPLSSSTRARITADRPLR